jgi:hypothetical protein
VSLKSAVMSLMGTSFEMAPIVQSSDPIPSLRPVVEKVDQTMQEEESVIQTLRRQEYQSFAPILSPTDPAVRAATFRSRFEPSVTSEAERRARAERALMADAPVASRRAPLITSPEMDRMEKRALRSDYQSIVPVMRKTP